MDVRQWDACGILCCLFVWTTAIYAQYVGVCWFVLPVYSTGWLIGIHCAVFTTLLFLAMTAHLRAVFSDPGIMPVAPTGSRQKILDEYYSRTSAGEAGGPTDELLSERWSLCGHCLILRPPRAHHCRVCGRCVRKMDHHCPWINNCVGEFNQKYFLQFLFYSAVVGFYCLWLLVYSWVTDDSDCILPHNGRLCLRPASKVKVVHSIVFGVGVVMLWFFSVAVACDQVLFSLRNTYFHAVFTDETRVEQVQKVGSNRRRKSKVGLLKEVCGPGFICFWLLPCFGVSVRSVGDRERRRFATKGSLEV